MAFKPRAAAHYLIDRCDRAGCKTSNLGVQKLLFLAHGALLAATGAPLVNERFSAWKYGPVLEDLYHDLKVYGSADISAGDPFIRWWPTLPDEAVHERWAVDGVVAQFGAWKPGQLVALTHKTGSPWHQVFKSGQRDVTISDESIQAYFGPLLKPAARAALPG